MVAVTSLKLFESIIGGTYDEIVDKNKTSHENSAYFTGESLSELINAEDDDFAIKMMKLDEFRFVKHLGEGQFGSVSLVTYKDKHYAMKVIIKKFIENYQLQKHCLSEKRVMENVNFPFVMKFYRAFIDQ